jgi:hypothetical protein
LRNLDFLDRKPSLRISSGEISTYSGSLVMSAFSFVPIFSSEPLSDLDEEDFLETFLAFFFYSGVFLGSL